MDDLLYDVLVPLQRIMDQGSLGDAIVGCLLAAVFVPLLVLVHELRHALAVKARRLPLRGLKVGDRTDIALSVGAFRMELGRLVGDGDVGTLGGAWTAVANLRPASVAADPSTWSDGLWARVAWRGRHHRGPMWPAGC